MCHFGIGTLLTAIDYIFRKSSFSRPERNYLRLNRRQISMRPPSDIYIGGKGADMFSPN